MQRLPMEQNGTSQDPNADHTSHIVPDHNGNLRITVKKTKPILGIAIEGGANTKHPLPRIINIHVSVWLLNMQFFFFLHNKMFNSSLKEHGAAYDAGGLEVGQLILEVDGNKVEGMHHQVNFLTQKI